MMCVKGANDMIARDVDDMISGIEFHRLEL